MADKRKVRIFIDMDNDICVCEDNDLEIKVVVITPTLPMDIVILETAKYDPGEVNTAFKVYEDTPNVQPEDCPGLPSTFDINKPEGDYNPNYGEEMSEFSEALLEGITKKDSPEDSQGFHNPQQSTQNGPPS